MNINQCANYLGSYTSSYIDAVIDSELCDTRIKTEFKNYIRMWADNTGAHEIYELIKSYYGDTYGEMFHAMWNDENMTVFLLTYLLTILNEALIEVEEVNVDKLVEVNEKPQQIVVIVNEGKIAGVENIPVGINVKVVELADGVENIDSENTVYEPVSKPEDEDDSI